MADVFIDQRPDATNVMASGGDVAMRDRLASWLRCNPTDASARQFLIELLLIAGDWHRASLQIDALLAQDPTVAMLAAMYRNSMMAERDRYQVIAGGGPAAVHAGASEWMDAFANAFGPATGVTADTRADSLAAAPDTPGEIDGRRFDFLFDGDQRFGPAIEAIVGGRWGLIPFAAIASIDTEGPVDLRDLVWLPAEIRLRDGRGLAALLPVTYPGTGEEADAALRLARRTEWRDVDGIVHGVGQRVWTTSAGEDVPILEFRRLRFDGAA